MRTVARWPGPRRWRGGVRRRPSEGIGVTAAVSWPGRRATAAAGAGRASCAPAPPAPSPGSPAPRRSWARASAPSWRRPAPRPSSGRPGPGSRRRARSRPGSPGRLLRRCVSEVLLGRQAHPVDPLRLGRERLRLAEEGAGAPQLPPRRACVPLAEQGQDPLPPAVLVRAALRDRPAAPGPARAAPPSRRRSAARRRCRPRSAGGAARRPRPSGPAPRRGDGVRERVGRRGRARAWDGGHRSSVADVPVTASPVQEPLAWRCRSPTCPAVGGGGPVPAAGTAAGSAAQTAQERPLRGGGSRRSCAVPDVVAGGGRKRRDRAAAAPSSTRGSGSR